MHLVLELMPLVKKMFRQLVLGVIVIVVLYIHVYIPLVRGRVEKAPAGCILRSHHTASQTTQHGHHIILDGTCD